MIIRTIHIDSFGGLRDFTLEPDAGTNVIFGPNESGKSSLAGFVKFMLYGLPSREKSANPEKSRALSRDGGSASGWMTVRTDGGDNYRLERSVRPGDTGSLRDRVRIVNEKTGESAEGVNPGEFFLGVPEEVFSSTAFVRQGPLRPGTPEGSASGNGAMRGAVENLLTSADESVDLRRAAAALEEQKRILSQKNGGGEISALAEKRAALLFAQPVEVGFQYEGGGHSVDPLPPLFSLLPRFGEYAVGFQGGAPLVHKDHRQPLFLQLGSKGPALFRPGALAPVHIPGQAKHDGIDALAPGQGDHVLHQLLVVPGGQHRRLPRQKAQAVRNGDAGAGVPVIQCHDFHFITRGYSSTAFSVCHPGKNRIG